MDDDEAMTSECTEEEREIKGLMAQIYRDLHTVAVAQGAVSKPRGLDVEVGERSENEVWLEEVSVGVRGVISEFPFLFFPLFDPPIFFHPILAER